MIKMTKEQTAQLRQADNKVIVEGVLVEKKLEVKEYTRKGDNGDFVDQGITGTIDIRTGENEVQTVRLFSYATKKGGGENGNFKGYKTIMNETVSQADVADGKGEVASKLHVQGSLQLNEYYGQDEVLRSNPQISGLFVNRVDGEVEEKATFDVEIVVKSVVEEFNAEGEETGRVIVEGFLPLYNSVVPLKFVVGENGAEYVLSEFEQGRTVNIWGKMTNFKKVTKVTKVSGFGEDSVEDKTEFLRELEITGGTLIDEGDNKEFNLDLLKTALQAREVYLANKLKESKDKGDQPKADGFGGKATGATKKDKAKVDVDAMFG